MKVWMVAPGGEPEQVPEAEIGEKMWAGYRQCDPPAEEEGDE